MQSVNVLPIPVSQETDFKSKDSLVSSGEISKESGFSRLVDQHVNDERKPVDDKSSQVKTESVAANNGNTLDKSVPTETKQDNTRQESGSLSEVETNNSSQMNENKDANIDVINQHDILAEESSQIKSIDNEALAESEQFISLLYNSDQTLSSSADEVKSVVVTDNQAISSSHNDNNDNNGNNTAILSSHLSVAISHTDNAVAGHANDIPSTDEPSDKITPPLLFEHKLKSFSKDEVLTPTTLKNNVTGETLLKPPSDQALKDYQLSLQSQKDTLKNDSVSNEPVLNSQLLNAQLKNNNDADLVAAGAFANKSLITNEIASNLDKVPTEPMNKEVLVHTHNKNFSPVTTEVTKGADNSSQNSTISEAVHVASSITDTQLSKADTQLSKANIDKLIAEQQLQAGPEKKSIEQSIESPVKQSGMTSAQVLATQTLQQSQIQENEQNAIEKSGEDFIESILSPKGSVVAPEIKTTSNLTETLSQRMASDLQAQTAQATQTKQSNDAYSDHQSSEVLNYNVATDTAQIQKNNVQLQQETVSIFRKDFADAVKDKVMVMISQKLQQFDITLDPPEFGNMQVRVNLQGEQAAVNFVVQNQQAKEALEQNMHKLKEMLAEQGVDVGGANVEQQDQQQSHGESNLDQNNDDKSLLSKQNIDVNNVEHLLSAQSFISPTKGVDYYA